MKARIAFAFRTVCIIASTISIAPAGFTQPCQNNPESVLLLAENKDAAATAPESKADGKAESDSVSKTEAKGSTDQPSQFTVVVDQVEQLILEFYPRAKIVRKGNSLDVKFKLKQAISNYTGRTESMPDQTGVMCTVELRPGRYTGPETLDTSNNQYYYTRMTEAPYSKSENRHLFAQISYPPDASSDFVTRFKTMLLSAVSVKEDLAHAGVPETIPVKKAPPKSIEENTTSEVTTGSAANLKNLRSSRNLYLWRATRGDEIVYLLGTIHVAKPSFYPLPQGILDAFNESNHLFLEIDVSNKDFLKKCHEAREKLKGTYDPPNRLQDKLSPRTKKALDEYIKWAGENWDMYNQYKPWLAMDILAGSLPRRGELEQYKGRYGIDFYLIAQAILNDVKVGGLEPPDREFLAKMPEAAQDAALLSTLLELKNREKEMKGIFEMWKAGDLEGIGNLDLKAAKDVPDLAQYHKVLLDDRNAAMVKRLMEIMKTSHGPFFVAVGSAHMPGKMGVLELMKHEGFTVEQMQNSRPSFAGLDSKDVSAKYKFAPGPALGDRKRLYNIIQSSQEKGVGITGYMMGLEQIEAQVKRGAHQYEIEREIDRLELGMAKQFAPHIKQVITPYCVSVEQVLIDKLKGTKGLEKGSTLACTIGKDGKIYGLRKSVLNDASAAELTLALEKVKAIGSFPPPPKYPLRLTIIASNNAGKVEAWHRGAVDKNEFIEDLQEKVRSKWHIYDFPDASSSVTLTFRVRRSGAVEGVQVVKSSGSYACDEAIVRAVLGASPMRKLPDGFRKSLDFRFTVAYVVR